MFRKISRIPRALYGWLTDRPLAPSAEDAITTLVGWCIIDWAEAEQRLSDIIIVMRNLAGDRIRANLPISMKAKLAFVNKATKLGILPIDLNERLVELAAQFRSHRQFRNDMTHGALFLDFETRQWSLNVVRFSGQDWETTEQIFTSDMIFEHIDDITALRESATILSEDVWDWGDEQAQSTWSTT